MAYVSPTLNVLIGTIKKASNSIKRDFNELEKLQSSQNIGGFITNSLKKIEKNLSFEFSKVRPNWEVSKILLTNKTEPYLLVNPIDGIENFGRGIPHFSVSAALMDENNNVLAGVVYNPTTEEVFFAEKSNGAFKEGFRNLERLRVSNRKDLKGSLILSNKNISCEASVRNFGCTSLDMAYLAASKVDAVIILDNNVASLAPSLIIIKEAGGYVYDMKQANVRVEDLSKSLIAKDVFAVNALLGERVFDLIKD